MRILNKYMYGGKSTYENGGIPRRPPRPVKPNYVPNPRENSEVGKGLSAKKMRALRKMTDKSFDEKAKSGDYTPQTKQRRFVEDLKPQTVIDKEKAQRKKDRENRKGPQYEERIYGNMQNGGTTPAGPISVDKPKKKFKDTKVGKFLGVGQGEKRRKKRRRKRDRKYCPDIGPIVGPNNGNKGCPAPPKDKKEYFERLNPFSKNKNKKEEKKSNKYEVVINPGTKKMEDGGMSPRKERRAQRKRIRSMGPNLIERAAHSLYLAKERKRLKKKGFSKEDRENRPHKWEEGGYLGYQKPEEYKDIKLRPSEIPMFQIHRSYSDLDKGTRRDRRTERYTKKYKKKMDKAYEKAAKERAAEMEEMEGMNERQKRRYKRKLARHEKRHSRRTTRRERRAERKGYGHPDDYLYGEGSKMGKYSGKSSGYFYIDPETGEQMFKTRKFKGKDEPPSYTRHASIRYLGDEGIYEKGDKEAYEKGKKALEEDYGIIEGRGSNRTKRREARFNRRQNRKWDRKQRREKRRQRKYM